MFGDFPAKNTVYTPYVYLDSSGHPLKSVVLSYKRPPEGVHLQSARVCLCVCVRVCVCMCVFACAHLLRFHHRSYRSKCKHFKI